MIIYEQKQDHYISKRLGMKETRLFRGAFALNVFGALSFSFIILMYVLIAAYLTEGEGGEAGSGRHAKSGRLILGNIDADWSANGDHNSHGSRC